MSFFKIVCTFNSLFIGCYSSALNANIMFENCMRRVNSDLVISGITVGKTQIEVQAFQLKENLQYFQQSKGSNAHGCIILLNVNCILASYKQYKQCSSKLMIRKSRRIMTNCIHDKCLTILLQRYSLSRDKEVFDSQKQ